MLSTIGTSQIIGLVIIAAGALLAFNFVLRFFGQDETQTRLQTYVVVPKAGTGRSRNRRRSLMVRLRLRLNSMLSRIASESLNLQLARANWPVTVPEFVMARLGVTLAGFVLGWLLGGMLLSGAGLAVVAYIIPGIYLQRSITRRQTEFAKQLVDILVLLHGAVRAGHSLLQAMEVVMSEMQPPASEEVGRVVREVGLGVRLPVSLRNLSHRMQNNDLDLVVTSIDIQYQVGGNMAVILEAVTETIRERLRLFGEVRVLTTTQRYSSYLLSVLPIVVGGIMFLMNPGYMSRMFQPGPILCVPIGAGLGIVLGYFVIQRVSKIDV